MRSGTPPTIKHRLCVFLSFALTVVGSVCARGQTVGVPSVDQLGNLEAKVRETFAVHAATTAADKLALTEKLVAAVDEDLRQRKVSDQTFATLTVALKLAKETSNAAEFHKLLTKAEANFQVDGQFSCDHIKEFLKLCTLKSNFELAWPLFIELAFAHAEAERFDSAIEILRLTANNAKDKSETARQILNRLVSRIDKRKSSHKLHLLALERLKTEPNNPKANFAVGFWLAVYKSKWRDAEPYFLKCDQAKWKAAAELTNKSTTFEERAAAADAWWNLRDATSNEANESDADAAIGKYLQEVYAQLVTQNIDDGAKSLMSNRMLLIKRDLDHQAKYLKPDVATVKIAGITHKAQAKLLPRGQWIDALKLVRLPEDQRLGRWQLKGTVLTNEASRDATCRIPIMVRGNYEYQCSFTRKSGSESLVFPIPIDTGFCILILSGWDGKTNGLFVVDGKVADGLGPKAPARSIKVVNGVMQNLSVAVSQSNGAVSITATLNGQVIVNWQGTVGQLAPWAFFHFGRPEVLGVATHQCVVEYHRFALMVASEKTPKGVEPYSCAYKLSDDWLTPITAIKDAPPAIILPQCKLFEGRPYYFSEDSMSFPEAQCLAKQLGGRLLTISTFSENGFIMDQGNGLRYWMAATRPTAGKDWSDDRGRSLRYMAYFTPGEPSRRERETTLGLFTGTGGERGWHDLDFTTPHVYPCIEWGEEYPQ